MTRPASQEERLALARTMMPVALAVTGFLAGDLPVCPACHKAVRGKQKVFPDGGFHCYRCGFHAKNAIDFLQDRGYSFPDALRVLENPDKATVAATAAFEVTEKFQAVADVEVYARAIELCSVDAAIEFYGRWGISPDVVVENRSAMLTDVRAFSAALVRDFSPERLQASGLVSEKNALLLNRRYPVIEPHILPDGRVSGLQFRAAQATEAEIAAHNSFKARQRAAASAGVRFDEPDVPYVAKFMSLRGASIASRCGFGLPRVAQLIETSQTGGPIYIVEGYKDLLAARTMGLNAYGLAGAGLLPVRAVCRMLSHFRILVAHDGDEAGDAGAQRVIDHLATFGVKAERKRPPEGCDITDVLARQLSAR